MFSKRGFGPNCIVILAVDSTARPFECDIGEKPNILAGYREFNRRVRPATGFGAPRRVDETSTSAEKWASRSPFAAPCLSGMRYAARFVQTADGACDPLPILFEHQRRGKEEVHVRPCLQADRTHGFVDQIDR